MGEFDYLENYNIQKKINDLAKKYKNKKIIAYGAGKVSDYIFTNYNTDKLNIIAIADKKYEKIAGEKFHGISGIAPDKIKELKPDCVIIFNLKADDIINYIDESIYKNRFIVPIEWVLKQNLFDYIKNKIRYRKPKMHKNTKYIFTFWEPKSKIPAYIDLCIKSWHKFLPEYKIVVLDYTNLDEWLGKDYYDKYLYENMSLPKQADAIRAVVLYLHGGIWFDADTIITSDKIKNIINRKANVIMFNTHIGFIVAKKGSKVLKKWIKGIKRNILLHKIHKIFPSFMNCVLNERTKAKLNNWNFLGNLIIDEIRKNTNDKEFLSLERTDFFALPENNYYTDKRVSSVDKYINFFFKNNYAEYVYRNEQGIICLHNSWTPNEYKIKDKKEVLNSTNTLSVLLKEYINGEKNDTRTRI